MADNKVVDNGVLADFTVATDDIGGVDYQRVKVTWGPDGSAFDTSTSAPLPVTVVGGTASNGAQTAVSSSAVSVVAADSTRKSLLLYNVGAGNVRVGMSGVTATTGIPLAGNGGFVVLTAGDGADTTSQWYAIRDGSTDSTVFAMKMG